MVHKVLVTDLQNYQEIHSKLKQELSDTVLRDADSEGMERLGGMGVWLA